jgi:hypothetical protein
MKMTVLKRLLREWQSKRVVEFQFTHSLQEKITRKVSSSNQIYTANTEPTKRKFVKPSDSIEEESKDEVGDLEESDPS